MYACCLHIDQILTCKCLAGLAQDYLNAISKGDPNRGGNYNYVCLAHGFTHQTFQNGIIGLAWVGTTGSTLVGTQGICGQAVSVK